MSILVEAISIVVRMSDLDRLYPGGAEAYAEDSPNDSYCSDGLLTRVGFMHGDRANLFLDHLAQYGLHFTLGSPTGNVAAVHQDLGSYSPVEWLGFEKHAAGYSIAWLTTAPAVPFAHPTQWTPASSKGMQFTFGDTSDRLFSLGATDILESFVDLKTGHVVYSTPSPPANDSAAIDPDAAIRRHFDTLNDTAIRMLSLRTAFQPMYEHYVPASWLAIALRAIRLQAMPEFDQYRLPLQDLKQRAWELVDQANSALKHIGILTTDPMLRELADAHCQQIYCDGTQMIIFADFIDASEKRDSSARGLMSAMRELGARSKLNLKRIERLRM